MAALDFEPSREEETFLQLIGLDRFITRVTWEIINASVIQEVITNLDVETMESKLNGRTIQIFGKAWRQTMEGRILPQHIHGKERTRDTTGPCNRPISQHQGENEEQDWHMQDQ